MNKLPILAESVLYLLTHAEWKTCYFYTLHELLHDVVCKTHVHLLMYTYSPYHKDYMGCDWLAAILFAAIYVNFAFVYTCLQF